MRCCLAAAAGRAGQPAHRSRAERAYPVANWLPREPRREAPKSERASLRHPWSTGWEGLHSSTSKRIVRRKFMIDVFNIPPHYVRIRIFENNQILSLGTLRAGRSNSPAERVRGGLLKWVCTESFLTHGVNLFFRKASFGSHGMGEAHPIIFHWMMTQFFFFKWAKIVSLSSKGSGLNFFFNERQ